MARETKVLIIAALVSPFLLYGWLEMWVLNEPYSYMMIKLTAFYMLTGFALVAASDLPPDRTGFPFVASLAIGLTAIPAGFYKFHIFYAMFVSVHVTIAIFGTLAGGMLAHRISKKQARRDIEIIPFDEEYRAALSEIYLNSRRETFYWVSPEEFQPEDFTKDTEGETLLIALYRKRPIGFISIWRQDDFIHHLYVDSRFKKLGAGKRLLTEGLKLISRPARLKCIIQNEDACRFYEKLGWRKENSGTDPQAGAYNTYLLE